MLARQAHRHLWQRLPKHWRRAALFGAARLAAPRPPASPPPGSLVIVAGMLRAATGLGQSARLCHMALAAGGIPVRGLDLTAGMQHGGATVDFDFADACGHDGPATIILHVNAPFVPLALAMLGRRLVARARIIGYWAWELPDVPPDWRQGIGYVHEVWVPSRFTAGAVRGIAGSRPVRVVPHPVAAGEVTHAPPPPRQAAQPFTVLVVANLASGFARKNPLAAFAAYSRAFPVGANSRLILKLLNLDAHPPGASAVRAAIAGRDDIVLDSRNLDDRGMRALYAGSDAVLSLHCAEGFGLVVAEAMLAGRTAVATDWSGNADFLTPANGMPVACRLVPARDPQGEYDFPAMQWAEPDIAAAAAALRQLAADPALATALGQRARADALVRFSASAYLAATVPHLRLADKARGAAP